MFSLFNLPIAYHSPDYKYVAYFSSLKWVNVFLILIVIGFWCCGFTGYLSLTEQSKRRGGILGCGYSMTGPFQRALPHYMRDDRRRSIPPSLSSGH